MLLTAIGLKLLGLVGVSVPSSLEQYVVVATFVLGVAVVFVAHVVWYYYRSRSSS